MKKTIGYFSLLILLLIGSNSLVVAENYSSLNNTERVRNEIAVDIINVTKKKVIDGATGASKLRAKKSHSVSTQDETKLTVFLGLFAMAIIVFFINVFTNKK